MTVLVAAYFVVATLQPDWLQRGATTSPPVSPHQRRPPSPQPAAAGSFSAAARKAPAVVSINTSKEVRHPRSNDPGSSSSLATRACKPKPAWAAA